MAIKERYKYRSKRDPQEVSTKNKIEKIIIIISLDFSFPDIFLTYVRNACHLLDPPGGRFKNPYELLNLRALKISMLYKSHIFQCMSKIFCVEFQRVPLKFHAKYLTHTLKDKSFMKHWNFNIRALRVKSSYAFLKRPPVSVEICGVPEPATQKICHYWLQYICLTHWGWDKMAAISQTTLSNPFSWMKIFEFRSKFHWSLFLRFQLTIFQHWFR